MCRRVIFSVCMLVAVGALAALRPEPVEAQMKPVLTRDVDAPGRHPYQTIISVFVPDFLNSVDTHAGAAIPANKTLVIEFVSVSVIVPTGEKPLFTVGGTVAGGSIPFRIPLTFAGPAFAGKDEYRATQLVRIYSDGDGVSGPDVACGHNILGVGFAECDGSISGYLIDK